jgi:hypothetical protein
MLILDSLGSSFELEYKGETYEFHYNFPTGDVSAKYTYIENGQAFVRIHDQFKALVYKIDDLVVEAGGKKIEVDNYKKFYQLPLADLQAIAASELNEDIKKKYNLIQKG